MFQGQELGDAIDRVISDPRQHLPELCPGIEPIEFRRSD